MNSIGFSFSNQEDLNKLINDKDEKKQFFSKPEYMLAFLEKCIEQPDVIENHKKFISKTFKKLFKTTQSLTSEQRYKIRNVLDSTVLSNFSPYKQPDSLKKASENNLINQLFHNINKVNGFELYKFAFSHDLPRLAKIALRYAVTSDNYLDCFQYSIDQKNSELRKACLNFYMKHLSEFIKKCSVMELAALQISIENEKAMDGCAKSRDDCDETSISNTTNALDQTAKAAVEIFAKLTPDEYHLLFNLEKEAFEYLFPIFLKDYVFKNVPANGFVNFDRNMMIQIVSKPGVEYVDLSRCENVDEVVSKLSSSVVGIDLSFTILGNTLSLLSLRCPNIQALNLYSVGKLDDKKMSEIAKFPKLRSLNLGACNSFSNKGLLEVVQNCPHIESLDFNLSKSINDESLNILKDLSCLTYLILRNCISISDLRLLNNFTKLEILDISHLPCPASVLLGLNLQNLKQIHFNTFRIKEKKFKKFCQIYPHLKHLGLSNIRSKSILHIIGRELNLDVLHLANCQVLTSKFFRLLGENHRNLTELSLEKSQFLKETENREKCLSSWTSQLKNLKSLTIKQMPLSDGAIKEIQRSLIDFKCTFNMNVSDIVRLTCLDGLECLDLKFENLTLDFLQPLIALLRKNPNLNALRINSSSVDPNFFKVDDEVGLKHIDKLILELPLGIRNLELNFENLEDNEFVELITKRCRHLVSLYLGKNIPLSFEELGKIVRSNPKLRLVSAYRDGEYFDSNFEKDDKKVDEFLE